MTEDRITLGRVSAIMAAHLQIYRWRKPVYQTEMLRSLAKMWDSSHRRVLDVGGGTGIIAELVQKLFPNVEVVSLDIENRFLKGLSVETAVYAGEKLPFLDGSFDAVLFNNVIHHVPPAYREGLIEECRRVTTGPLYIKDHLASSALDHQRLAVLDWIGNTPFKGMLAADYLVAEDWAELAGSSGYAIETTSSANYRRWPITLAFPNRLEITMRWRPQSL